MNRRRCPTVDDLAAIPLAGSRTIVRQAVEDHVEDCTAVRPHWKRLPQPVDALAAVLALPVAAEGFAPEQVDYRAWKWFAVWAVNCWPERLLRRSLASADITQSANRIGPYHLVSQINSGGMGTVWLAEQTEPVKRTVAIKLIKAGWIVRLCLLASRPNARPLG